MIKRKKKNNRRKGNFWFRKKHYKDFLDKILEKGEYNYENLYNPKYDIENELSST